jgi:putative membrane protein
MVSAPTPLPPGETLLAAPTLVAGVAVSAGPGWRTGTLLALAVVAVAGAALLLWGRPTATRRRRAVLWLLGVGALVLALASPLHDWAHHLVLAHMGQHMLLLLVAGPLLVGARLGPPVLGALPAPARLRVGAGYRRAARALRRPRAIVAVAVAHAAVVVAWHVPVLWEAAVRSAAVHWLEHAMFLAAGAAFWGTVLVAGRRRDAAVLVAGFVSIGIATVAGLGLGLLMTFATTPWYTNHAGSPGLDPLTDQQLAGVVMWSSGAPLYTVAAIWLLMRVLRPAPGERSLPDVPRAGPGPAGGTAAGGRAAGGAAAGSGAAGLTAASTGTPASPPRPPR